MFQSEDAILQVLEHPQVLPSHLQVIQQHETSRCFALQLGEGQTEPKIGDFALLGLQEASVCVHKLGPPQLQQSFVQVSPSLSRALLKAFLVAGAI